VTIDGASYALHHVPSGVFRPAVRIVIGNGTVLDLGKMLGEFARLAGAGVVLDGRLYISDRAHVVLPIMAQLDALSESAADASARIGTTLRGIGPTYEAKAARWGVRIADLADLGDLTERMRRIVNGPPGQRLRDAGEDPGDPEVLATQVYEQGRRLARYVADTALLLNDWIDRGLDVLFEGAQGTLLDLDHGSYPYVTSSSTVAGALCAGLGVAPTSVHGTVGVFKAYATRVGGGPMPTELDDGPDGLGERIRRRGREFGTTTGRPRRCGWFDGVAAAYANRLNRFRGVCISLLDVLDVFDEIRVGVGYRLDGRDIASFPASAVRASRIEPVYETLPGWSVDTTGVRRWEDLPANAQRYVDRLGEIIGAPVGMVGVGPDRSQCVVRPGCWLEAILRG
jgi:adenylosuccinate synthase